MVSLPAQIDVCHLQARMHERGECELDLLKTIVHSTIMALDFLHTEAKMIHTDVKTNTVFFTVTDNAAFGGLGDLPRKGPLPAKHDKKSKRYVYESTITMDCMEDIP